MDITAPGDRLDVPDVGISTLRRQKVWQYFDCGSFGSIYGVQDSLHVPQEIE